MANGARANRSRSSVWLSERPVPRRTSDRQPDGLGVPRIVAAAVRLLDAEGLAGFSMRRLAAELGVTAMSVYWYVDTKHDLLELALDAAMAEITLPPDDDRRDWRERLRELAYAYRWMLARHPWTSPLLGEYPNIGPQARARYRAARRVVRDSGLRVEQVPGALALVSQFVYGFGTAENRSTTGGPADRPTGPAYDPVGPAAAADADPGSAADPGSDADPCSAAAAERARSREREFAFALDCVVAGIEAVRDAGPEPAGADS